MPMRRNQRKRKVEKTFSLGTELVNSQKNKLHRKIERWEVNVMYKMAEQKREREREISSQVLLNYEQKRHYQPSTAEDRFGSGITWSEAADQHYHKTTSPDYDDCHRTTSPDYDDYPCNFFPFASHHANKGCLSSILE